MTIANSPFPIRADTLGKQGWVVEASRNLALMNSSTQLNAARGRRLWGPRRRPEVAGEAVQDAHASSRIQALRFSTGATFPLGGASLAAIAAQWRGPRGRLRSVEAERSEVAKLRELAAASGPASPVVRKGCRRGRG